MNTILTRVLKTLLAWMEFMREYFSAICRDLRGVVTLAKIETKIYMNERNNVVLADAFRKNLKASPNKACIVYYDKTWTFQDVIIKYLLNFSK